MMVPKGLSNLCWVECQKVSRLMGAFLTYSPYRSTICYVDRRKQGLLYVFRFFNSANFCCFFFGYFITDQFFIWGSKSQKFENPRLQFCSAVFSLHDILKNFEIAC